ncbi:hypothetical protein GT755_10245 [Herbidospora sp. NEAU-GS84]|uniref:Uncharacterized protein n=1 Tax=Herbidospora solisilvae TaxID=2696284 RepID=A0A7C9JD63_9ACTN|nr:phosphoribosyltransferase [Herbidospora solisilvae]NAS22063.1 hypothetical protein [Herbidospora solisilvae]
MNKVTYPTDKVVPITLCRTHDDPVYELLRDYKNHPASRQKAIARQTAILGAIIDRFYQAHATCLREMSGSDFDVVAVIPSTRPTPVRAIHPLVGVVKMVQSFRGIRQILLERGTGRIGRSEPADDAFVTGPLAPVAGKTVLLVDDILTTGAHVQSAASTLRLKGATCVVALVIGRIIDTKFNDNKVRIWQKAEQEPFDFERCCVEGAHP